MDMSTQQGVNPPPRDKELRSRVRLFGNLLGEVLASQAGHDVLAAVETLRKGYIRLRKEDNPALRARMAKTIDRLRHPDTAGQQPVPASVHRTPHRIETPVGDARLTWHLYNR
jgi:phosphoenolpyruvate carboxylase